MRLPQLRYSLRTFLVVIAIVACWFGYHLNIKHQRLELLAKVVAQGGEYQTRDAFETMRSDMRSMGMDVDVPKGNVKQESNSSQIRAWLGDAPVFYIYLPSAKEFSGADAENITELFPEALITIGKENISHEVRFLTSANHAIKDYQEKQRLQNGVKSISVMNQSKSLPVATLPSATIRE